MDKDYLILKRASARHVSLMLTSLLTKTRLLFFGRQLPFPGCDGQKLATIARKRPLLFRRLQDGGDRTRLIMNESSRSKGVKNVLSLQVAGERTHQAKAASDRQISERTNERLLERLEAENAQLRDCVVELMLEIQAWHDGAK